MECATSGHFELCPEDADIVVKVSSPSVLWQKERLLNIALEHLPTEVRHFAWLDCDIVFARPDWPGACLLALRESPIVQPFSAIYDLDSSATPTQQQPTTMSMGFKLAHGLWKGEEFRPTRLTGRRGLGFGWAARRDVFERRGFYDAMILGSGDSLILNAAFGRFDDAVCTYALNEPQSRHYLAWAGPFFEHVKGQVGFIEGDIFHLWHGDLCARRYLERHTEFTRFGFDPFRDLRLNDEGCWEWATAKPDMHEYVRAYFASRHEDGT